MEASSNLKLVIVKGPREGESIEFAAGSTVRIGRVVKGNNFSIKDSGISSKHLTITYESNRWIIRDLDSSNGTIINESKLSPNSPVDLNDGDSIKVGEYTLISVQISNCVASVLRRNFRRQVTEEAVGLDIEKPIAQGRGGRARVVKEIDKTKGLEEEENVKLEDEAVKEVAAENHGRRRGKPRVLRSDVANEIVNPVIANVDALKSNQCMQVSTRRTRSKKNEENPIVNTMLSEIPEDCNLHRVEEKIEVKKTRGRKKRNLQEEQSAPIDVSASNIEEVGQNDIRDIIDNAKGLFLDEENKKEGSGYGVKESKEEVGKGSISGVKQGSSQILEESELEKMTLGDWFDYLEVYLPKQIISDTEEMIENMRLRAKAVHEYRMQQRNEMRK